MKSHQLFEPLMFAGMLLFLSACGANATPSAIPAASSTALPSDTMMPASSAAATLTATLTTTPTPGVSPTPSGPFPVGVYRAVNPLYSSGIEFVKDGSFRIPDVPAAGNYVVAGNIIVLNETKGECVGFPGKYLWSFDGKTLTLKRVADACPHPRSQDLSRAWTKQP